MTTARADIVTLASAIDESGDTTPLIAAYGAGNTVAAVAGDAELLAAAATDRKVLVQAIGGAIYLSFSTPATAEPRGVVAAGSALMVKLAAGQSLRVAAAALS